MEVHNHDDQYAKEAMGFPQEVLPPGVTQTDDILSLLSSYLYQ